MVGRTLARRKADGVGVRSHLTAGCERNSERDLEGQVGRSTVA